MGRTTGIYRDEETGRYWVDKRYRKRRLREHFGSYQEAEEWLILQLENLRRQTQFGERPKVTFREAAARFLKEKQEEGKRSVVTDVHHLDALMPFIGSLYIDRIHDGTLDPFREARRKQGCKTKTINDGVSTVRAVLNRAYKLWRDEVTGLKLLEHAPSLVLKPVLDRRPAKHLTWAQQEELLKALPTHLKEMALFGLNTGARDDVICSLQWDWELPIEELGVSVFFVPPQHVKGEDGEDKTAQVLFLNSAAQAVIERQRGKHEKYVFVWRRERTSTKKKHKQPPMAYQPVETMNNTAWQGARERAGLGDLHVHDLRHVVATRLRERGAAERSIADILWHSQGTITAHYSVATMGELVRALELIKDDKGTFDKSVLTLRAEHLARRQARGAVKATR
ncbi:tyrosine-type recombinase/integrase [Roseateles sp. BYS78W]|uniref:Tyrosine-type recombinase/integrase n=1 Tax=Pelomonas candidula TaxID=3299025 RepID=A0ABW7HEG7_9BURK